LLVKNERLKIRLRNKYFCQCLLSQRWQATFMHDHARCWPCGGDNANDRSVL
jgi:hypothetical protein